MEWLLYSHPSIRHRLEADRVGTRLRGHNERMSSTADAPAGRVVDTHVHAGLTKYEPVESLVDQMFRHRVDHAVLVQHAGESTTAT